MLTSPTNVTDDPSSKPDQRYAGHRDRQNYIREKYVKILYFRAIRNPVCVKHWEGADFEVVVEFMTVFFHTDRFGLFLA